MSEYKSFNEESKNIYEKLNWQAQEIDRQKKEIDEKNEVINFQKNQINEYGVFIDDLLKMILHLLELRDPYTLGHSVRVAKIVRLIAEEVKVKIDIKDLQYGALLHDIGKIVVPDSILHKSSILSKAEKILIEQHTVLGYESVQSLRIPDLIKEAIYYHHENYDGTGYPLKLRGNDIPVSARIIKIADVYDALITDRPHRKSFSEKEAKNIMLREKNKYDPIFLAAFFRIPI